MINNSKIKSLGLIISLVLLLCALLTILPVCASHPVSSDAMLDSGYVVNNKMKSLAVSQAPKHKGEPCDIKAIRMANSLPNDFIPSKINTVSSFQSNYPIYIFFDNKENAGIIYFYTDATAISMNPSSRYLFSGFKTLTDISGVENWDASNVKDMSGLFNGAKSLSAALDIRNWDTSNVTDMSYMFSGASSLMFVDVSNWDTSNVTNMTSMFQVGNSYMGDGQLREINGLGDLNVSNVTDMTCMFYGAGQMTNYDISRWNVSKVESMNHMFCDNNNLVSLDLSQWDVSNVKTMYCMFDDCHALKTIGDVSHWNTVNLIDIGGWLNDARSFVGNNEGIMDLSGWKTDNLKAAGEMFRATQLHVIDLSGWTFDSIINGYWEGSGHGIYYEVGNGTEAYKGLGAMFKSSRNLKTVYISQSGLDSFNAAVEREVNILDMWLNTQSSGFTVK